MTVIVFLYSRTLSVYKAKLIIYVFNLTEIFIYAIRTISTLKLKCTKLCEEISFPLPFHRMSWLELHPMGLHHAINMQCNSEEYFHLSVICLFIKVK